MAVFNQSESVTGAGCAGDGGVLVGDHDVVVNTGDIDAKRITFRLAEGIAIGDSGEVGATKSKVAGGVLIEQHGAKYLLVITRCQNSKYLQHKSFMFAFGGNKIRTTLGSSVQMLRKRSYPMPSFQQCH